MTFAPFQAIFSLLFAPFQGVFLSHFAPFQDAILRFYHFCSLSIQELPRGKLCPKWKIWVGNGYRGLIEPALPAAAVWGVQDVI